MLLVQDQYVQNSRKNFDTELQLKQNTSKQVFSDSKEIWELESGCEEEAITSGNDSEGEDILLANPSDVPEEIFESKKSIKFRKKNVRFGSPDFDYVLDTSETSSVDNDHLSIDCGYLGSGKRRSSSQNAEISSRKVKDHFRLPYKTKLRNLDSGYDKIRSKSCLEKTAKYLESTERGLGKYDILRMRRKDHRCGRHHCENFDDVTYRKPFHRSFQFECGDNVFTRCCDCIFHCNDRKSYMTMKPLTSQSHRRICHKIKDSEPDFKNHRKLLLDINYDHQSAYHTTSDCCCTEEYYDHPYSSKIKKKMLESVQEQQEQFSDSTNKFSTQPISGEILGFPVKKSSEKVANSSLSDWLYFTAKENGSSLGEKLVPPRIHKMRSRRTRMNRIKNGWKKALVQTVRDGSRNERVGVIVMGSKGPEFYAKNSKKPPELVPFRKSKSFLDGAAKSFEVMTVDCKNVFLSSSEPGPKTNYAVNDLACPEDEDKVEEKIARFSKNVNEIVKNSEEKFYKTLSSSEYPERKATEDVIFKASEEAVKEEEENKQEENKEETQRSKFPQLDFLSFNTRSPRTPKSPRKSVKTVNENSKAMADALNKQAKQYMQNQSNLKNKEETFLECLKEFKGKYTPKEISQETAEANLSVWGMKLDQLTKKGEANEHTETEENSKKNGEEIMEEKPGTNDLSRAESVKSAEEISINQQRRKKYYESTTAEEKADDDGGAMLSSKLQTVVCTPKQVCKSKKWESSNATPKKTVSDADASQISAVFRDLVKNGCAISQEESENLQSLLNQVGYNPEICCNEVLSSSCSDVTDIKNESKMNISPRTSKTVTSLDEFKGSKEIRKGDKKSKTKEYFKEDKNKNDERRKKGSGESESFLEEISNREVLKMKNYLDDKVLDAKICKKAQGKRKEGKSRKKIVLEDRMKLLRQALPSIAAENEAAHLKQLKKYIDRFIDRVEASTTSEYSKWKENQAKSKGTASTDSSEVQVDAREILDFVNNPFKKISSDVTINIAKKLTDALVQDKSARGPTKAAEKHSESGTNDGGEGFEPCDASSGSERCEEPEPTYLKQLKKMRNEHLNNILLEVKRLNELLRFLDRCNRLHS